MSVGNDEYWVRVQNAYGQSGGGTRGWAAATRTAKRLEHETPLADRAAGKTISGVGGMVPSDPRRAAWRGQSGYDGRR